MTGHFLGTPIFPSAMMQQMSTQTAGVLIDAKCHPMQQYDTDDPDRNELAPGVLVRVKRAKFMSFARPEDALCCNAKLKQCVGNMCDFSATISGANEPIMRNAFQLANIASSSLLGR